VNPTLKAMGHFVCAALRPKYRYPTYPIARKVSHCMQFCVAKV